MKYDEKQLEQIIGRAIELQRNAGETDLGIGLHAERFTDQDIEEIARDSGLSVRYLRQSLAEFEGIPLDEAFFIDTFEKNHVEIWGYADGSMDQRSWAEIKSQIEKWFKSPGKAVKLKDGIRWEKRPTGLFKKGDVLKDEFVEITETGERMKLRIRRNVKTKRLPELPAWMCLIGIVLVSRFILEGEAGALFTAIILGAFSLLFFNWADKKKAKERISMRDLMEEMQTTLQRNGKYSNIGVESGEEYITPNTPEQNSYERKESSTDDSYVSAGLKNQLRE